jgi:hypothetical protein
MEAEPRRVSRNERLAKKLSKKPYRHAYLGSRIRQFLAHQMRTFRGQRSQAEFGRLIDQSQSVISERLESPAYGKWNLQTLLDIAAKLDVALIVQFVDWPTFIKFTHEITDDTVRPSVFDERQLNEFSSPPPKRGEAAVAFARILSQQDQLVGLIGKSAVNENEEPKRTNNADQEVIRLVAAGRT